MSDDPAPREDLHRALMAGLPAHAERAPTEYVVDGIVPTCAVRPTDRRQAAFVLERCAALGAVVVPQGARSALALGRPLDRADVALDLTALDRIVAYEPDDMTVTVEAGVTLHALRARLREHGQDLPVDLPPGDGVSVGGMLAAARPGPSRGLLPGLRDLVLGVTVALPDGTLARSGGRVVKNVSGYDLHRLHTGALGAYGVIVEASFKVAPAPRDHTAFTLHCTHTEQAVALAMRLRDQLPGLRSLLVAAPRAAALVADDHPRADAAAATLHVEVGGSTSLVTDARARLHRLAALHGASGGSETAITPTGRSEMGERFRRLSAGDAAGDDSGGATAPTVLRLGVPPEALSTMLPALEGAGDGVAAWAAPTAGAVWVTAPHLDVGTVQRLRAEAAQAGGFALIESAPAALRGAVDPWGLGESALVEALRQQFDPTAILNRGRWLAPTVAPAAATAGGAA